MPEMPTKGSMGDYLLGILRYWRDHQELNEAEVAVIAAQILVDDAEMLDDLESAEGAGLAPADAIYSMLDSWFEGE